MGYKADHPLRWATKHKATAKEQKQLSRLLSRSPCWHNAANRRLRRLRSLLGYDHADLQSSEVWLKALEDTLLKDKWWSERRGIAQLGTLNRRRSGLILLALYHFAQHSRLQFKPPIEDPVRADAASPYEELEGNHHNLDHQLLRTICHLCRHRDAKPKVMRGPNPGRERGVNLPNLKKPSNVAPNTVMRWAQAAESAGGVVPRSTERLRQTWKTTAAPAWKRLQERSWRYFPAAWRRTWRRSKVRFLLIGAIYAYGAYYSVRCVFRLLHF